MRNRELTDPHQLAVARRITSNISHWLSLILLYTVLLSSAVSRMLGPAVLFIKHPMVDSLGGKAEDDFQSLETHPSPSPTISLGLSDQR